MNVPPPSGATLDRSLSEPVSPSDSRLEECLTHDKPLKVLRFLYAEHTGQLIGAVFCYLFKHSPIWLVPIVMANAIDRLSHPGGNDAAVIARDSILLVLLLIVSAPVNCLHMKLLAEAQRKIEIKIRTAISGRLHILSMENFAAQSSGPIQSKLLRDVESIGSLTRALFESVLSNSINVIFALVVLGMRQRIFLLFFAVLVPVTVYLTRVLSQPLFKYFADFHRRMEMLSTQIASLLAIMPMARAHGAEESSAQALQNEFQRVHSSALEMDRANALFGVLSWGVMQVFYIVCFTVAILASIKKIVPITPGEIVLISTYFILITNSFLAFINMAPVFTNGVQSIRSISEMFRHPEIERNEGKPALTRVEGEITFEEVDFRYKNSDRLAINGLSFRILPGETVALVGRSGAGKSTVIKLILGFLQPAAGRVLVDGQDLRALDLRSYRKFLSIVPQELAFFSGSIAENVGFGRPGVTEEEISNALDEANAMEFVSALPNGIHSFVGEKGGLLSGGQRQRLAIAAALIRNPRILILDEATSALDTKSEAAVQEALVRLMKNRTCIVIAHRPSTLQLANRIFSLQDGQLVESGSREDLLRSDGVYSTLYRTTSLV